MLATIKEYYLTKAIDNLLVLSRTAVDGQIDISAGGDGLSKVCAESIGSMTNNELAALKSSNPKAAHLDLFNLKKLRSADIKRLVIDNFTSAITMTFEFAESFESSSITINTIQDFIMKIAQKLGSGIAEFDAWFRTHDSDKFLYTRVASLQLAYSQFCTQLFAKIYAIIGEKDKCEKRKLTIETAAWVEYRVNLTDHFITDSCSKTAIVLSCLICVLGEQDLPKFNSQGEYFSHAPKVLRIIDDETKDKEFQNWLVYYQQKFSTELFKISEHLSETALPFLDDSSAGVTAGAGAATFFAATAEAVVRKKEEEHLKLTVHPSFRT